MSSVQLVHSFIADQCPVSIMNYGIEILSVMSAVSMVSCYNIILSVMSAVSMVSCYNIIFTLQFAEIFPVKLFTNI